jgi:hypothetical protein
MHPLTSAAVHCLQQPGLAQRSIGHPTVARLKVVTTRLHADLGVVAGKLPLQRLDELRLLQHRAHVAAIVKAYAVARVLARIVPRYRWHLLAEELRSTSAVFSTRASMTTQTVRAGRLPQCDSELQCDARAGASCTSAEPVHHAQARCHARRGQRLHRHTSSRWLPTTSVSQQSWIVSRYGAASG